MTIPSPASLRLVLRRAAAAGLLAAALAGCGDNPEKQLASAREEIARKDYKAAAIRLKGVLQKDENQAEARYLLGRTALETGDVATAEKHLRKAAELGFDAEKAVPELARAMIEAGDFKKVLTEFSGRKLGTAEGRAQLLVSLFFANLATGQLEPARKALADALAAKPDAPRVILAGAWMKGIDKDLAGGEALVDSVLARDADVLEALGMKAGFAAARGDRPGAVKAYQRIAELQPTNVGAHYSAFMLLMRDGKNAEAKAQVESLRKAAPKHPLTAYMQAIVAYQEKDVAAARDRIAAALKGAPDYLPALLLSGLINAQFGTYGLAEQHLNKVLAQIPNSYLARRAMIGILLQTGRAERALELAQALAAQAPENPDALGVAASAYMLAGDAKHAAALFEKSASLAPKNPKTRTGLALARFASGDPAQAMQDLEAASAADASRVSADVLMVLQYLRAKKFDKAIEAAAVIERKMPQSPATHNLKGQVYSAAGKPAEARASFEKALQLKPDFVPALINLGRLDLAEKKPDAAKKRFEEVIARQPKNIGAQIAYVDLLTSLRAPREEVRRVIERAVAAAPSDSGARIVLIGFHVQGGNLDLALKAAQEANAAIAGNARLLQALGELQLATKAPDQAVTTLTRAVELDPQSPQLLLQLADAQSEQGSTEAALQSLRKVLALQPGSLDAQIRIAAIHSRGGHLADAVKSAKDVQKQRPEQAAGYLLEGDLYSRQKKWNEAIAAYRAGLERTKGPLFAIRLHQTLVAAQRKPEADKVVADWIRSNPKDGFVRNYLAERAALAGDHAESVRQYQALAQQYPKNGAILNNLAWAAYEAKDPRAPEWAEQANRLAPDNAAIMDTLGWILAEKGDLKRGIELLQKSVAKAPQASELRLHLAKALVKAGRKDEARKELDTLAKLGEKYPKQPEVAKLLSGL